MKMFNKNRKSFGNNNYRRNDRNTSYRRNDRNNKFGQKNGGRKKFVKSEQIHEEEDATPWHVMKQNLKPSIAIKNPEIEDDWNTEEKQKSKAAKLDFMRQKDERYRKFVIENERKALTKWDSFSDVEQSGDEQNQNTKNNDSDESDNDETGAVNNINSKHIIEICEDVYSTQKIKKCTSKSLHENIDNEIPILANKKPKKNVKRTELSQEAADESTIEEPVIKKKKKKEVDVQVESPSEKQISLVKKRSKREVKQSEVPQTMVTEVENIEPEKKNKEITNQEEITILDQPKLKKKKSKKHVQPQNNENDELDTTIPITSEKTVKPEKENKSLDNIEKPEETFLESLASQKQNEPFLFESSGNTKSGPKCFACRQYGHSLKQCRDFDNTSTRICIKCGSNEHAYQNCTVHKGRVFKFASCFICKQTGHISSQCKEKKNGVYPDGGNCRYCSSVEHLGFNCPRRPGRKKKRKFSKNHNSKPNDKLRQTQNRGDRDRNGSGRVQKNQRDNKIKRNFK